MKFFFNFLIASLDKLYKILWIILYEIKYKIKISRLVRFEILDSQFWGLIWALIWTPIVLNFWSYNYGIERDLIIDSIFKFHMRVSWVYFNSIFGLEFIIVKWILFYLYWLWIVFLLTWEIFGDRGKIWVIWSVQG